MVRKIDWLPALTFMLFGAIFLYASFQIVSWGGGNEGRMVPAAASALVLILATIQFLLFFRSKNSPARSPILLREFALHSAPVIILMAVYALLHIWFGYLMATFAAGFIAFRLFGNTWTTSLIHSVAGTLMLYIIFVKVLGIYDPPGRLFDFSPFIPG